MSYLGHEGTVQDLKLQNCQDDYLKARLKGEWFYVHRIVAEVFIPNPDNLPEVDHIDRNRQNNCVDNLRWTTAKENSQNRDHNKYIGNAKKKVLCVETKQVFDSVKDALEWAGIKSGISACLAGKQKTAGGYMWEYID